MRTGVALSVAALLLAVVVCATLEAWLESQVGDARGVSVPFASWHALWTRHSPRTSHPPVDFATDVVVGVFAGQRPTAGYEVEIVAIERQPGETTVVYRVTAPPRDALVARILTSPFHLARLPRHGLPIQFQRQ